jgi:tetratricopeptide (TPR) repeat protein
VHQDPVAPDVLQAEETRYLLRSPGLVACLSALVMGLGQIFNGQYRKAAVFLLAELGVFLYLWDFLGTRVVADTLIDLTAPPVYHVFLAALTIAGVALWIYNINDAYQVASFLSFIFDRTMPVLAEDEQEFVQASLSVGRMGMRVHRGATRKFAFVGLAILLYSSGLLTLGARYSVSREENALETAVRAQPDNVQARLRLGELLLARADLASARRELEEGLRRARAQRDIRAAYRTCTALARVYTELGQSERANGLLREALSLYTLGRTGAGAFGARPDATASAIDGGGAPGGRRWADGDSGPGSGSASESESGAPRGQGQGPRPRPRPRPTPATFEQPSASAVFTDPATAGDDAAGAARPQAPPDSDRALAPPRDGAPDPPAGARAEGTGEPSGQARGDVGAAPDPAATGGSAPLGAASSRQSFMAPAAPTAAMLPAGEPAELLAKALVNFKVRNYGDVRKLLDAHRLRAPWSVAYGSLAGRLHAATGHWEAAVPELERAVRAGTPEADLELLLAEAFVRTGRPGQAVRPLTAHLARKPHDPEAVLLLADVHRKAGRGVEARRIVEEALIESPDHHGLLAADFSLAVDGTSDESAYQVAMKILKEPHRDREMIRTLLTQAMDARRFGLAHRIASACIRRDATDPMGYVLKGSVLVREGEPRKAMPFFEKASSLDSDDPELVHEIAGLYGRLGKDSKAIECLRRALDLDPRSVACARDLGDALRRAGYLDGARAAYQQALRVASDPEARLRLGEVLHQLGRTGEARETFQALVRADPSRKEAREARRWLATLDGAASRALHALDGSSRIGAATAGAVALGASAAPPAAGAAPSGGPAPGDLADDPTANSDSAVDADADADAGPAPGVGAKAAARGARRRDRVVGAAGSPAPRDPTGRLRQADLAYRSGETDDAERLYREVLALDPRNVRAHFQLGLIQRSRRNVAGAVTRLETALRLAPQDPDVLMELGLVYTDARLTRRAIQRLEQLLRIDPRNLAARYTLGVNYEKAKLYTAAEEQYRAIQRYYPGFAEAHDYLGNLYFSQRRFRQARAEFEHLARAIPQEPRHRFKLAVTLHHLDDRDRAREQFEALTRILPSGDPLLPKVRGYLGKL